MARCNPANNVPLMKIVVRDTETYSYIKDEGNYTSNTDEARDFTSITEAKNFCRKTGLRRHSVLLLSQEMVVSEMHLGDC